METLKKQIGNSAEQQACRFLTARGLQLIEQNYHCFRGEIDLIMREGSETIVFVEVRARSNSDYGDAIETITRPKQKKIIATATYYLQQKNWLYKTYSRFDVVGIQNTKVNWIKNAFTVDTF